MFYRIKNLYLNNILRTYQHLKIIFTGPNDNPNDAMPRLKLASSEFTFQSWSSPLLKNCIFRYSKANSIDFPSFSKIVILRNIYFSLELQKIYLSE